MAKDDIVDASSENENDCHKEIGEEHEGFFDGVSQSAEEGAINALLALKMTPVSTTTHPPQELPPQANNQPRREHNLAELSDDLNPIDPSENDRSNQIEIGAEHGGSFDGVLQSAKDIMINAMSALNITPDNSTRDQHPHPQKESNNQPTKRYHPCLFGDDDDEPTDDPSRYIPNALYDPKFEEMGLPIDPHLRAMMRFNFDAKPLPRNTYKKTASKDLE